MSVVISAKDVGIEFYTSRRRKMQVRDLLFNRSTGATSDTFWALRNISFDIHEGEAVGLVGGNGSGKSTLLKTLAGVLLPDEGDVTVDGGVAPLIELTGPQVREALDRPYRHLSSGMQVRLGFAVISSLDEPIFLVDEVLAVGDKGFREKCYRRMETLLSEGRTLFLVSHSEKDLKRFGTRGLYVRRGELVMDGPMDGVLDRYNEDLSAGA